MKPLIAILIFISSAKAQMTINGSGKRIKINAAGINSLWVNRYWRDSMIIDDDGYYNGFPMIANAIGFSTVGIFKKSGSHAAAGPLPLIKTINGGRTWTQKNIAVDGTQITSSNHSFIRHSSGRLVISYRVSGVIYFAYNDNNDTAFTSSATTISPGANNVVAQSPVKMVEMPSGNILFIYYQVGSAGNPAIGSIMESTNNGLTFSFKSNIFSHNSAISNATLGDWRGNEVAIAVTHNTGIDSTCKMIALARTEVANDGGTYPMFFYSANGGTTWTKDLTGDPGSFVDDNGTTITNNNPGLSRHLLYSFIGTNSPFDIINHNGTIYVVNGERNTIGGNKYALKYITATPDSAYQNKWDNWARPVQISDYYNAATLGATTDCGYPVIFIANGHLYVGQYDVSTQAAIPAQSARRVYSQIKKVI